MRKDPTTQGNWPGNYGSDGSYLDQEPWSPPPYGSVTFSNAFDGEATNNTSDPRALVEPPPQTSRIVSEWYAGTGVETIHVSTTDGHAHTVALYLLDWDNVGTVESITAQTPSGTVLDTHEFSRFSGGVYAVYQVCGSTDFVVTSQAHTAVVNGIFFGPPAGTPSATNYLVDTSGGLSQVVADTDGSGKLTSLYVRNGDELLAVMRPGATAGTWTTRFVHSDGLGSVRVLTDESGTTVDSRGYEAFGTKNVEAGDDPLTYGFAGEPFDGTTKLAYHRARWMDARVGRFEGMDSFAGIVEAPQTLHRYSYVSNEAPDLTDPSGLISPLSLLVGQAVHDAIGSAWEQGKDRTTLSGRVYDQSIRNLTQSGGYSRKSNWLMKLYFGVSSLARPDLAATGEHAIYEIKAVDELVEGEIKLGYYLDILQTLDPDNHWRLGFDAEYTPPSVVVFKNAAVGDYLIQVDQPEEGVITYSWQPYDDLLKAAMSGIGAVGEFGPDVSSLSGVGGL